MDLLKVTPRAQPDGLPSENPKHPGSLEGELFQTTQMIFNNLSDFRFLHCRDRLKLKKAAVKYTIH